MQVSHETIYKSLFIQARGVLKKSSRRTFVAAGCFVEADTTVNTEATGADKSEMPYRYANDLQELKIGRSRVTGKGDLLEGSKHTQIATLVERQSRYVMLVKVPRSDTTTVVRALTRRVQNLPKQLRRSLTWDRGKEMASHKSFSIATDVKVYFCDPHSPWQRGSSENTNGLLRQYFPKRTDLSGYSQAHLDRVARQLNQRPRETLGFQTPADKLHATVASTH